METQQERNRNLLIAILAVMIFFSCVCLVCVGTGGIVIGLTAWHTPSAFVPEAPGIPTLMPTRPLATPTPRLPLSTPLSTPTPQQTAAPPTIVAPTTPGAGRETEAQLKAVIIPTRSLRDLAERLRGIKDIPVVVNPTPPVYEIGDESVFWISDTDTDEHFQITAELRYMTDHVYMWVEKGARVSQRDLERSANRFEKRTYPTDREFFGSEWTPGVDNDVHLTILHAHGLGRHVAGYFSGADEVSHLAQPYSNEREMFYINLD
ncbi:MAG TPA: hypothetical protein EYP04_02355, partial [Anaerolineae bacterium]|nr:hypothetical protein [Anaerolineae bacterium]